MKLSIETLESVNFGDHGERLRRSHAQVPGETVEQLVTRVFTKLGSAYQQHDATDELVLRVVVEPDGQPSGQAESSYVTPF